MSSQGVNLHTMEPQVSTSQPRDYRFPLGIFLVLGSLAGVAMVLAWMNGLFEQWHPLNPPPSRPLEFAGIDVYFYQADPYVVALDGNIYLCDVLPGNSEQGPVCAWRIQPPLLDIVKPVCQSSGIKFWFYWQPFNEIVDCAEAEMAGEFIGAPEVTYIIDEQGLLWYWSQENRGNIYIYLPFAIILGLLAGYLAALLWSPLVGMVRKSPPDYCNALRKWESRVLRFGGRLLSVFSLLYFVGKLLTGMRSLIPYGLLGIMSFISIILVLVGLVISWRWEVIGGALVLTAFLFALPSLLLSLNLPSFMIVSLPYLPGLMFLVAGLLNRREKRLLST